VTSADLQYLFGIQRSEPDCMTRLVSEHETISANLSDPVGVEVRYLSRAGSGMLDAFGRARPLMNLNFSRAVFPDS
jgi:hypothetical protein